MISGSKICSAYIGLRWSSMHSLCHVTVASVQSVDNVWRIGLKVERADPETGELGLLRDFNVIGFTPSIGLAVSDYGDIVAFGEDSYEGCSVWALSRSGVPTSLVSLSDVRIWSVGISADGVYRCYTTDISMNHAELGQRLFLQYVDGEWTSFSLVDLFGHGVMPQIVYVDGVVIGFSIHGRAGISRVTHSGSLLGVL